MPQTPDKISDSTLRVLLASGIGPATLRKLRNHFDTDDRIVGASVREFTLIDGIANKTAAALRHSIDESDPQHELDMMHECGASLIITGDADYPSLLSSIPDPPVALWIRGALSDEDNAAVGVVGSRRCTSYGREQAARFASLLGQCGYTIVSGGALGIDGEAHRGALRAGGRTIAVMGCGLSRSYPPEHRELFEQIVNAGSVLLSEFPMSAEPRAEHFPRRNRVISGLSVGVLVVEAAQRSGALITARLAAEQHGREVMALPGRVDSPASTGCLGAIREGWAGLVTSPTDVLHQLESAGHLVRGAIEASGRGAQNADGRVDAPQASDVQQIIVDSLQDAGKAIPIDELARRCGIAISSLMAELTMLEMRGQLKRNHVGVELRGQRKSN